MNRLGLILAIPLLIWGHAISAEPATRPTTRSTTRPLIKPIDLRYGIYQMRLDIHTTITADGVLRSVRIDDKSYGAGDIDPKNQKTEIRQGQLTEQQMTDLGRIFTNWDSLSSNTYSGVTDGPDISLRYGDKTVSGGSDVPKQVRNAQTRIFKLTELMPVAKE